MFINSNFPYVASGVLSYLLTYFRPCGQSLFEVALIAKMQNQKDFQPIARLIFLPNTMFLQGNETTKSSISLSFCLAMASPFALNYHNGVKKFMNSQFSFKFLSTWRDKGKSAALVSTILIKISNWNSIRILQPSVSLTKFLQEKLKHILCVTFPIELLLEKQMGTEFLKNSWNFRKRPQSHLVYPVSILEESLEKKI